MATQEYYADVPEKRKRQLYYRLVLAFLTKKKGH